MDSKASGHVAPLQYRGVPEEMLQERAGSDGIWAMGLGLGAVVSAWGFWKLQETPGMGGVLLLTFPLVAVVPMLGLSGVVRGVEAVARGRQVGWGAIGVGVSVAAMVGLGRMLVGQ